MDIYELDDQMRQAEDELTAGIKQGKPYESLAELFDKMDAIREQMEKLFDEVNV